jgi:hypothetical protein
MFQQHNTWWDLLCVLDLPNKRGTVQTAEEHRIEEAAQKGKQYTPVPCRAEDVLHEASDAKFFSFVLSGALCSHSYLHAFHSCCFYGCICFVHDRP